MLFLNSQHKEEVLSLDAVISEVLSNNPALKAANANWEAMRERVPQARAWEDPRMEFDQRAARFVGVPVNSFPRRKADGRANLTRLGQEPTFAETLPPPKQPARCRMFGGNN